MSGDNALFEILLANLLLKILGTLQNQKISVDCQCQQNRDVQINIQLPNIKFNDTDLFEFLSESLQITMDLKEVANIYSASLVELGIKFIKPILKMLKGKIKISKNSTSCALSIFLSFDPVNKSSQTTFRHLQKYKIKYNKQPDFFN